MSAFAIGRIFAAIGTAIVVVTGLLGGFNLQIVPFLIWGSAPYALLFLAARQISDARLITGAGAAALAVEVGIRASVFLFPRGSTAGLALLFSPPLIAFVVVPLGAAGGWLFGRAVDRAPWTRVPLASAALVVLGLTVLGFARPELFPTTVVKRRAARRAIGDPRVVLGADAFQRIAISRAPAWHVVGELDGGPGEEVAVVDHHGAAFFDPATLSSSGRVSFGGQPGRLWSWSSRFARVGDELAVVQTGGGFSETELRALDTALLWKFRPDPHLPPSALLPGDLDGDGATEFYASSVGAITRLDGRGKTVWTRPATLPEVVALAPAREDEPAWIVATRYESGIHVWDADGRRLSSLPWPNAPVHGIVDWPRKRAIVIGDRVVKGIGLDGATLFQIPIEAPLVLNQAVAWRPSPASSPLLAIVAGGDRDLARWRLRVVEPLRHRVLYDEVFARSVRLLAAKSAGGGETLFVSSGELSALVPRRRLESRLAQ